MFKKAWMYVSIALVSAFLIWLSPLFPHPLSYSDSEIQLRSGVVRSISDSADFSVFSVETEDGMVDALHYKNDFVLSKTYQVNDPIILTAAEQGEYQYLVEDYDRYTGLYVLFVIFVLVALVVTGRQGLGSLLGLFFSFAIIFSFILPQILLGQNPVLMVIAGATLMIPVNFFLSHGFYKRTFVAIVGTLLTLIVSGLLAYYFAGTVYLTGVDSEEINFLTEATRKIIDFQGIILAGVLISVLGILDDVTVSQASIIQQLKNAKPRISFAELFYRAMRVGRDHIASLVNTLILVYAGASLPLLLLFLDHDSPFRALINIESVAAEIVQMLIGSIGLILAVPLTTLLGVLFIRSGAQVTEHVCCAHGDSAFDEAK